MIGSGHGVQGKPAREPIDVPSVRVWVRVWVWVWVRVRVRVRVRV